MNTNNKTPDLRLRFKALAIILILLNGFLAKAHDIPLISAEATCKGVAMKDLTVRIYRASDLVIEIPATEKKKIFFSLQENSNYTIVFSKPGYITRSISVDTHIPEEMITGPVYSFEFELGMLEEDVALNTYYLDFPIALVGFNKKTERFEYNHGYTDKIRKGSGESLFSIQENSGK
jgi:hypothetical protein